MNERMKTILKKEGFPNKNSAVLILILGNKARQMCYVDTSFLFTKAICFQK